MNSSDCRDRFNAYHRRAHRHDRRRHARHRPNGSLRKNLGLQTDGCSTRGWKKPEYQSRHGMRSELGPMMERTVCVPRPQHATNSVSEYDRAMRAMPLALDARAAEPPSWNGEPRHEATRQRRWLL